MSKKGSDDTDNADFREIMEKYGDMIYRITLTHTLDRNLAEDNFQETFLSLAMTGKEFENEEHLKRWLIRTAVNRCISCNRRSKLSGRISPDTISEESDTAVTELKILISDLPEKYRAVIYLCCFEGCTARNAAEILGKREGTVKSLLSRGRKLLKKELEEQA